MSDWDGGNDWNGNGDYDAFDMEMDYELHERDSDKYDVYNAGGGSKRSTYHNSNAGKGGSLPSWAIWIIVIIIASIINPLLGGGVAFFWIYGMIFLDFH